MQVRYLDKQCKTLKLRFYSFFCHWVTLYMLTSNYMCLLKNLLRIITAGQQHLCIISNSAELKLVRKLRKYRQVELCPASSPLGDSSPGRAGESPSVLLSTGITAARDKSSVGKPWVRAKAYGDAQHRRNRSPSLSTCHVIKEKRDELKRYNILHLRTSMEGGGYSHLKGLFVVKLVSAKAGD